MCITLLYQEPPPLLLLAHVQFPFLLLAKRQLVEFKKKKEKKVYFSHFKASDLSLLMLLMFLIP